MSQRNSLCCSIIAVILICILVSVDNNIFAQSENDYEGILRNPLNSYQGADPWLTYYEGNYYLATTTWSSELTMRVSPTLAGLKTATPIQIYYENEPARCCNMWAPEFYLLDGPNGPRWYFYYTAGSADQNNQHMHVLESTGTDPLGPYHYKDRIYDPQNDTWSIDGSILQLNNDLYFLFSAWIGRDQSLFIASMSNPWTLSSERVLISQPEYDWETTGLRVNEAPVALYHDDNIFVIYSASFCGTPDYKLGMLTYNGNDPLDPYSWVKHPEPVFQQSEANGVYGPAHNGFFKSPDGTEDWIVYHANDSENGVCDNGRTTRVQRFTWNEDGTPNFGVPVATTELIAAPSGDNGIDPIPEFDEARVTRFESYSLPGYYLSHQDNVAQINPGDIALGNAEFYVVPGLADPEAISIVSFTIGTYLRHDGNAMYFQSNDGSEDFAANATWWVRAGLANEEWISLESYDKPGFFMGQRFGVMALVELSDTLPQLSLEDATFWEEN